MPLKQHHGMLLGKMWTGDGKDSMNTRLSSVALALVVALAVLGMRFVDAGSGHQITAQAILFLFVLGAPVGAMVGLAPRRSRPVD